MTKSILCILLLFCVSIATAQKDFEKSLDSVQTLDDVTIFLKKNKTAKGKVIVFNREKHNTRMADRIFSMRVGAKRTFGDAPQKTYYKVIEKYAIPYYRVSVVYLDGNKISKSEINAIRSKVISKYNEGYMFKDLARQYSMDNSAKQGGDIGWFTEGDLHPEFERQIIDGNYRADDIFTIDVPETNSFYVALMTYDKRLIEEAKVLKITEPRK
ncbi:peptidylprolyl isomerase [Psychroserpens sp.]|uniref:peptidylprolyl isomerase n=1 Tax=Psychroserpens sp. TaxID=2020870 RepID=UPI001B1E010F|nr:peptidylprolyl isomerase [Psychroserpens sp.]MBO6606371.1 peptidylprolyl isomerase [Psychroserpens sp.]MBO6653075.1 peptidylprolyl isomerase [Psychroserpens sp.]MBO6680897.1 peptidylprolyl isomerase [Psychroserpens sp.]MBO6750145.1 peptidylprolyl isomerase [Psychroserpens sp.]MBO6914626.1 peptidylprolyl isomerase [Psychroserpens sp.]